MECLRWRGSTGWVYLDSADLNFSNRPVRTRMPGGVAGARPDGRPLCRFSIAERNQMACPCIRPGFAGSPRGVIVFAGFQIGLGSRMTCPLPARVTPLLLGEGRGRGRYPQTGSWSGRHAKSPIQCEQDFPDDPRQTLFLLQREPAGGRYPKGN